ALRAPEITFWSVWDGDTLAGCGAVKSLDPTHAELKSMRTRVTHKRTGVATGLMEYILAEARRMGFTRMSLETGSDDHFEPARPLYEKFEVRYSAPSPS